VPLKNSTLTIVPSESEAETSIVIVAGATNPVLLVGEAIVIEGGEFTGAERLLVTVWAVKDAACPPAEVCKGLVAGFV